MKKNIVLIGFMGSGKSSVGKILAKKMDRVFLDLDEWIERKEGLKISKIFEKNGEQYFRALEKEAVRFVSSYENRVITTGGGVVLDPENLENLRQNGIIVSLIATPETIFERVKNSKHRPLLDVDDKLEKIRKLYDERISLYQKADYQFKTDGLAAQEVAGLIFDKLNHELS